MSCYNGLADSSAAYDKRVSSLKGEPVSDQDSINSTSPSSIAFAWRSTPVDKLLPVCSSILSLLAGTSLLVTTVSDKSSTGRLPSFVLNNRATTQIVVYIISTVLASLNIYTITKLLNLGTSIHLLRQSLSLSMITSIRAISTKSLVAGPTAAMFARSTIIVLFFALPNILWTGALTPVFTNTTMVETNVLKIPQHFVSSNATWSKDASLRLSDCNTITNKYGIFSDCPARIIQSSLLSRAAQATSNPTQTHSKNDNSYYTYVGRSYGVGSPAGLVDENLFRGHSNSRLLFYNYTEPGYLVHASCFHNASSDFHLKQIQERKKGIPYLYYATGLFPTAEPGQGADFFAVFGLDGDNDIAALAAKRYGGRNIILVTAGSNYIDLNGTQCEVSFTPTMFGVGVDVANKIISVLPINTTSSTSPSFDPTAGLAITAINQINGLSMISTSLYTSVLGDALVSNINDPSSPYPPTAFAAMADSFSAMLDDVLLFIGSSQSFVPNMTTVSAGDYSTVDVHMTFQAVRLGEARYVWATFGMCVMLLAAVLIEAWRTKVWRCLPRWDFMDTTGLVLASAVAAEDVVGEMCRGRDGDQMELTGGGPSYFFAQGQEEVQGFQLKLGKKVLSAAPANDSEGITDGYRKVKGGQKVQLTAVSLWTRGAKGIEPLR